MKVYSLSILSTNDATPATSNVLCQVNDLSSFSFYMRGSVGDFMTFLTKTVAERTKPNVPEQVSEDKYKVKAHVFRTSSQPGKPGLAAVVITDEEYPLRPAFSLLTKILDEQANLTATLPIPTTLGGDASNPSQSASGGLGPAQKGKLEATLMGYLTKWQDPKQADTIMKVQKELDETKVVLHKTIESVLERGEKLDDLVERSNQLSNQSKMFYRTAKKQNSCCVLM